MTMQDMIKKYNLQVVLKDGVDMIRVSQGTKIDPAGIAYIKDHRVEIIALLKAEKAAREQEERELRAATVTFRAYGWESHEVSVDTREDLDAQFARLADYYANDLTYDSIKADYAKHVQATQEKAAKKAAREKAAQEKEEEALRQAAATGEKQVIRQWMEDCNDYREECSMDSVVLWAMPDGTTIKTRRHTW